MPPKIQDIPRLDDSFDLPKTIMRANCNPCTTCVLHPKGLRILLLYLWLSLTCLPGPARAFTSFPRRVLQSPRSSRGDDRTNAAGAAAGSNEEEEDVDPDLMGVRVDGYPIPATPCRPDDAALLAKLYNVPGQDTLFTTNSRKQQRRRALSSDDPLCVIVAGGGLGGLAVASALLRQGVNVHVLEQAVAYQPFGGPIQLQSNALWALQQMAPELYEAVRDCGVQTGDRLSGIKDGKQWQEGWLVKFDAATPARKKGLPLTLAINRVVLQEIFLKYGVPPERVHTNARVMSYDTYDDNDVNDDNDDEYGVTVHLEDGRTIHGGVLVGADGIWSRVRHQMCGLPPAEVGIRYATQHAIYSGYTCFTGTCQHIPDDIDTVAYKVFLGQQQYLGCTDAGYGWQHWWAFLPDEPIMAMDKRSNKQHNNIDNGQAMLERLKREFRDWSPEIHDLFQATQPQVVRQRDLFDRKPMWPWTDSKNNKHVVLLGDACHPTMPNLGQGGAMAMEDAYVLALELADGIAHTDEIPKRLERYAKRRFVRASMAQFLSRNGSDLLVDWDKLRQTPIVGPLAMGCINFLQPISMNYLYSADI
ncbi:Zeaxanthin epoxidase, chloroplastic [Seminavis robusta]|uniref:Zeaxanthin epoxidase, chloroplastic n=1 Tax=Seminavis robusta TaxID=568900 RepID=A0A9N8H3U8_9STRA|nr:Zeaxanthin epoxidase, chloroplastic [Seminavis robusta]|eukprot:Sro46_g027590.1 Zeaxanthin epoxidase, chloroplastic (587) ;mRNA; r:143416-145176